MASEAPPREPTPPPTTPQETDIRRLQAFAVHSLDRLDAQRKDIDRISSVDNSLQSEMSIFRDFMQETRDKTSLTTSAVGSEAAEILATNLSGIRRKANEVDELKMQLGMMKLRVKTLENETRTLKATTTTGPQPPLTPRAAPSTTPDAHRPTGPASAPSTRPQRSIPNGANKRPRSSLGDTSAITNTGDEDMNIDLVDNDPTPIDPQLLPATPEAALAPAHHHPNDLTTTAGTTPFPPRPNGSPPTTPSIRTRASRNQRPILTNEKGERLRRNGEVDKRAAWNRQYAAERRTAQARARTSLGEDANSTAGGNPRSAAGYTALRPQLAAEEVERETQIRRDRDRRVREAFDKEGTVDG